MMGSPSWIERATIGVPGVLDVKVGQLDTSAS